MENNRLLRHALATLAYRTRKALAGAPDDFGQFDAGSGVRTPRQLTHHMTHLLWYTAERLRGGQATLLAELEDFEAEVVRFQDMLRELSALLAEAPIQRAGLDEKLLQGPISDAMTHVGQLALLRRLAGAPIPAEDFSAAEIVRGDLRDDHPA